MRDIAEGVAADSTDSALGQNRVVAVCRFHGFCSTALQPCACLQLVPHANLGMFTFSWVDPGS
jgi:hypothetical protein